VRGAIIALSSGRRSTRRRIDSVDRASFLHTDYEQQSEGNMLSVKHLGISLAVVAAAVGAVVAQTIGQPEEFTAVAIQNNNLGSGPTESLFASRAGLPKRKVPSLRRR
jgi:hypothetical protein